MLEFLKRLRGAPARRASIVHPDVGAALLAQADLPQGLEGADAMTPPLQIDGDPAPGRLVSGSAAPAAPRDVFVLPGGLGLPALALVNLRDPQPRVEQWSLDTPELTPGSRFAARLALRLPAGQDAVGWQVRQAAALPRLQCLVVLGQDDMPRTALVAVMDVASGRLRALGQAEPDPFVDGAPHCAALRPVADAVLVRWHSGRVRLGRWGDVAVEDHIQLFAPREPHGLEVLTLALDDGNVRAWGMRGTTLWLQAIDGRPRPEPRVQAWSLDLARVV